MSERHLKPDGAHGAAFGRSGGGARRADDGRIMASANPSRGPSGAQAGAPSEAGPANFDWWAIGPATLRVPPGCPRAAPVGLTVRRTEPSRAKGAWHGAWASEGPPPAMSLASPWQPESSKVDTCYKAPAVAGFFGFALMASSATLLASFLRCRLLLPAVSTPNLQHQETPGQREFLFSQCTFVAAGRASSC